MLTLREIVYALYGAIRLARADASGMGYFDATRAGFWRSFYAAALVAPLYAAVLIARMATDPAAPSPLPFAIVEASAYVIHWVAYPLLMVTVCRRIGCEQKYVGYIVAYNWAAVLQNVLFLPLTLLGILGAFGTGVANFALASAFALILLYDWFIARTALGLGNLQAIPLVIAGLFLNLFIGAASESLLRP